MDLFQHSPSQCGRYEKSGTLDLILGSFLVSSWIMVSSLELYGMFNVTRLTALMGS